jgi:uncharacterized protein YbjT (DUF2867 family)
MTAGARPCQAAVSLADLLHLPFGIVDLAPVDVGDIAKVAYRLLRDGRHESERLDMTGPEALTMDDIAARISTAVGRPVRYEAISADERRKSFLASGMPTSLADALDEQLAERLKRPRLAVFGPRAQWRHAAHQIDISIAEVRSSARGL